tara:strand:- start:35813 stop:36079 length:267 start_codon:yes stop_codon:yes gene_type:complete
MSKEASQSLRMRFKRACKKVWDLQTKPTNEQLLNLYALFKQATEGDCEGKARGSLKQRAKWKAWNSISGTSQLDAMKKYCLLVNSLAE